MKRSNPTPMPILILPEGTDKAAVRAAAKAGYIPIVTANPEQVRLIVCGGESDRHKMLMAALAGVKTGGLTSGDKFFTELYRQISDETATKKGPQ